MKSYLLKGKQGRRDISFFVDDLIPVSHKRRYRFNELVALINYSFYRCDDDFEEGYKELYSKSENRNADLFKIRGTNLIIIPGNTVFPTILKETDIK